MIYTKDINDLLAQWTKRMAEFSSNSEYVDGVRDCIYDLNQLLTKSLDEELAYKDYVEQEQLSFLPPLNEEVA